MPRVQILVQGRTAEHKIHSMEMGDADAEEALERIHDELRHSGEDVIKLDWITVLRNSVMGAWIGP